MNIQASDHSSSQHNVFSDMSETGGPLDRVLHVMNLLAVSGAGLGEVLPDYAQQTGQQMEELMQACDNFIHGKLDEGTLGTLRNTYNVLSSAATVLDMAPAAMQRNRAEAIGTRKKMSREEVVRSTRAFRMAPDIAQLMESEALCDQLVQQAMAGHPTMNGGMMSGTHNSQPSAV